MTDINSLANLLREIKYSNDEQWLAQFLDTLPIPKSTNTKLKSDLASNPSKHAKLLNRADFVLSNEPLFRRLIVTNDKKSAILAIHLNNGYITVFNRHNHFSDTFYSEEIADHLDIFLELIYGNAIRRDLEATQNFAATIAQLANQLITDNPESNQELRSKFVLDLTTIAIAHSFKDANTFDVFSKKSLAAQELNYTWVISHLMRACSGVALPVGDALLPRILLDCICEPVEEMRISKASFNLCISLLLLNARTLDAELLASSIYKFVNPGEAAGIYGHQTSHQNVLLLLNPLLLDELKTLSEQGDEAEKLRLIDHIRKLKFLDPTDGPGCFLSSAMRSLMELESQLLSSLGIVEETGILLQNFIGLVSNTTCQQLSRLTIWLTYLQFLVNAEGSPEPTVEDHLESISIYLVNQLESDWDRLCKIDKNTYILGSPKFLGSRKMSSAEKASLSKVFKGKVLSDCDFSSGWLVKSSEYIKSKYANASFVLTNSVCQGSQVSIIWPQVFSNDTKISFARPSMKWRGGADRASGVTVVIVGLTHGSNDRPCRIFHETKYIDTSVIGPYLVAGTDLIVYKKKKPLEAFIPIMRKGNMPYDSGFLLLNESEREQLIREAPSASKFLKRIVGSEEFIHKKKRWCIWLHDSDLAEAENIPEVAQRIASVKKSRLEKSDAGAIKLASRPHQFRETRSTAKQTLVVPSVSSENREYIPIGFIGSETVVSNLAFAIYECEPWIFSLLNSRMHNLWIRTVCGALETRLRYSNELGYNTFPFPAITEAQRKTLDEFARDIIGDRECYPELTLGDLYSNLPETLRVKHEYLDVFVDSLFCSAGFSNDNDRLEYLFKAYREKC